MSSKFMACFVYLFWFWHFAFFFLPPLPMQSGNLYNSLHVCIYTFQRYFLFYFNNSKSCIFHSSLILFYSVWFLWSIFLLCAFFFLYIYTHIQLLYQPHSDTAKTEHCQDLYTSEQKCANFAKFVTSAIILNINQI